jgi:probable addiction module antidote protein
MPKAANKVKVQTTPYDVARHLRTPEEMALYLDASIRESDGDPALVAVALGDIARAKGMAHACQGNRPWP